jgi:hypothetical protein
MEAAMLMDLEVDLVTTAIPRIGHRFATVFPDWIHMPDRH